MRPKQRERQRAARDGQDAVTRTIEDGEYRREHRATQRVLVRQADSSPLQAEPTREDDTAEPSCFDNPRRNLRRPDQGSCKQRCRRCRAELHE